MGYVVIDHHHDEPAGVYRLTIGREVTEDRAKLDEDGTPILTDQGAPATERVLIAHEDVREYVFAADDPRWQGLPDEEIAATQRSEIQATLDAEARDAEQATSSATETRPLPGVGASL